MKFWQLVGDAFNFIVVGIFFKYIVVRWIADKMTKALKVFLVRTEHQAVAWIHYKEKARGHGHQYPTPELCQDGVCRTVNSRKKDDSAG